MSEGLKLILGVVAFLALLYIIVLVVCLIDEFADLITGSICAIIGICLTRWGILLIADNISRSSFDASEAGGIFLILIGGLAALFGICMIIDGIKSRNIYG